MFKLMYLLKRKPGTSLEEFIHHYENSHAKIGKRIFDGKAVRYMRRYLRPMDDFIALDGPGVQYDVAMECWFEDRAHFDAVVAASSEPEILKLILEDEERFMDRTTRAVYVLEEYETELAPVEPASGVA
uniref:EthD domain-containing protein n=1 Tax=Sphingomonas sp. JE1 TaxID=1628059 RepID=A0A0D4ZZA6_9SPHN|nr:MULTISPECIES: EthD domain-containing protein [unclassified Sphingomonas]AJW29577.1 hypothetical protein pJE1_155 [Sphingomonas sp. JE1]